VEAEYNIQGSKNWPSVRFGLNRREQGDVLLLVWGGWCIS